MSVWLEVADCDLMMFRNLWVYAYRSPSLDLNKREKSRRAAGVSPLILKILPMVE